MATVAGVVVAAALAVVVGPTGDVVAVVVTGVALVEGITVVVGPAVLVVDEDGRASRHASPNSIARYQANTTPTTTAAAIATDRTRHSGFDRRQTIAAFTAAAKPSLPSPLPATSILSDDGASGVKYSRRPQPVLRVRSAPRVAPDLDPVSRIAFSTLAPERSRDLNTVLRGWGAYFRWGNSARKLTAVESYVHERLAILTSVRHRHSGATGPPTIRGLVQQPGVYRLSGAVRYWNADACR